MDHSARFREQLNHDVDVRLLRQLKNTTGLDFSDNAVSLLVFNSLDADVHILVGKVVKPEPTHLGLL